MAATSYPGAVGYGLLLGIHLGVAAGTRATLVSAIPYGLVTALVLAAAESAFVAYRNGQPPRR